MLERVGTGFRCSENSAFVADALLPPAGFGAAAGKWATLSERRHAIGFYFRASLEQDCLDAPETPQESQSAKAVSDVALSTLRSGLAENHDGVPKAKPPGARSEHYSLSRCGHR